MGRQFRRACPRVCSIREARKFSPQLLDRIGYDSGFEITIKLHPAYELVPDVIAAEGRITNPYPTEPFEVVVEILSTADPFSRVLQKCHLYETLGIRQVGLVDPDNRVVRSFENGSLRETDIIARRGERVITAQELWAEVDRFI